MRAQSDITLLDIPAGGSGELTVDVVNTSDVIDGVLARVIGLPASQVSCKPSLLSLFPEASGSMALTLTLPPTFPAGRHPLTVEIASSINASDAQHLDLDLDVAPHPELALRLRPAVQRGRRRAKFTVECVNRGNVPLDVVLSAVDADRSLRYEFTPQRVRVEPGTVTRSTLSVRAPRHLVGNDRDRPLTVHAETETPETDGVEADAPATLRQRPVVARGVLTALVLASVVALWALAFLLGLTRVFATDPLTKTAPASFFVSSAEARGLVAAGAPGDALSKDGALPAGVGGAVAGKVTASTTGAGAGRIVVEALRSTSSGLQLVTSAATQSDGSYSLVGLFPGSYLLRFSSPGYRTVWYPSSATQGGAKAVNVDPQAVTPVNAVQVTGLPASITGQVDPGDTVTPVRTTVTARPLQGNSSTVVRTVTDAKGNYTLTNLPSPGTYELGFTAPGYQPTTVVEKVGGGQNRVEPTVRLSAGDGAISGTVTDGRNPLGGVVVTTTADGHQLTTGTPTLGTVGKFTLGGLTTPGTYVVTFTMDGYGAQTVVVDLGPGQNKTDLNVALIGGTGTVSGRLVDESGNGLGGATVTVGGTPQPASTTTLTTGSVGAFAISGLPTPGSYTLTVTLSGYTSQTVPVTLDTAHPAPTVNVTLARGVGRIRGQVLNPDGTPSIGATVTVTDGKNVRTTTTVDNNDPSKAGGFLFADLPPGAYSVTVTNDGYQQQTALVRVVAGQDSVQSLTLQAPS